VRGTLGALADDGDLIGAAFPPGSVTGAPKVRAVARRRAYGGRRTATAWQNASNGSPPKLASTRTQMFAWKMSPRLMYSTARRAGTVLAVKHAVRPQERL